MQNILVRNISEFHYYFKGMAEKIPRFKKKRKICGKCIDETREDLNYIYNKYENIMGFIINHSSVFGEFGALEWNSAGNQILNQYLTPLMGYQQDMGAESALITQTCNVCMYPLRGNETVCPNCSTRLVYR